MPAQEVEETVTRRLEQMLDKGLDDIDAGRVISQAEARREIEAMFSAQEAIRAKAQRR